MVYTPTKTGVFFSSLKDIKIEFETRIQEIKKPTH